ncbi:MAG: hypothetical protein ACJAV2_004912, partial [Myxococcota bacterium]
MSATSSRDWLRSFPIRGSTLSPIHTVLGLEAALRARVVRPTDPSDRPHTACPAPHEHWIPWGTVLLRVFGVDRLRCPRCSGEFVLRAFI